MGRGFEYVILACISYIPCCTVCLLIQILFHDKKNRFRITFELYILKKKIGSSSLLEDLCKNGGSEQLPKIPITSGINLNI